MAGYGGVSLSYKPYPTRDAKKNYFPLPNEIFDFGLSSTAIALYAYLMKSENRKTYDCFPAYKTIAKAIGVKSKVTVAKYVSELEEKQLIRTEQRTVPVDIGIVRKSTLRYNIRPIQEAIDLKNERQMAKMEQQLAIEKAAKKAKKKGIDYRPPKGEQSA